MAVSISKSDVIVAKKVRPYNSKFNKLQFTSSDKIGLLMLGILTFRGSGLNSYSWLISSHNSRFSDRRLRSSDGGGRSGGAILFIIRTVLETITPLLERKAQFARGADLSAVRTRFAAALACRF